MAMTPGRVAGALLLLAVNFTLAVAVGAPVTAGCSAAAAALVVGLWLLE